MQGEKSDSLLTCAIELPRTSQSLDRAKKAALQASPDAIGPLKASGRETGVKETLDCLRRFVNSVRKKLGVSPYDWEFIPEG